MSSESLRAKPRLSSINLLMTLASFALFGLACIVIDPRLEIVWYLALKEQLRVLGIITSLQTICLQRLYFKIMPLLKANHETSRLQNHEAILTKSTMTDYASKTWRGVILVLVTLPLVLPPAYKQFTGGVSQRRISTDGHFYGPTAPPGIVVGYETGITVMSNITLPFMSATANDSEARDLLQNYPHAFGFNQLLLSNQSTVFLDAPTPYTVLNLQRNLSKSETYSLSAPVSGLVALHNTTLDTYRASESFWTSSSLPQFGEYGTDNPAGGLYFYPLFNPSYLIGLYAFYLTGRDEDHTWLMLSVQPSSDNSSTAIKDFKTSAQLFNFAYHECNATWNITPGSIELETGSCSDTIIPWDSTTAGAPAYHLSANDPGLQSSMMPSLGETLGSFAVDRRGSPWLIPTMATTAAAMTYSRVAVFNNNPSDTDDIRNSSAYHLQDTLISRRQVLNNHPLLYLVVVVQPILTLAFFVVGFFLYTSPVDSGSGLTGLLAGVDVKSLA